MRRNQLIIAVGLAIIAIAMLGLLRDRQAQQARHSPSKPGEPRTFTEAVPAHTHSSEIGEPGRYYTHQHGPGEAAHPHGLTRFELSPHGTTHLSLPPNSPAHYVETTPSTTNNDTLPSMPQTAFPNLAMPQNHPHTFGNDGACWGCKRITLRLLEQRPSLEYVVKE